MAVSSDKLNMQSDVGATGEPDKEGTSGVPDLLIWGPFGLCQVSD